MTNLFTEKFPIQSRDFTAAGEASTQIKGILKMLGIEPVLTRRVTIAAYESEMNMIIHSQGGMITLEISPKKICLSCIDTGPGIADISAAMQEGFSTATEDVRMMGFGAGMGLPNIKRNSDSFSIESDKSGTSLFLDFNIV